MALPRKQQVISMDYSYFGVPGVYVTSKPSIKTLSLDYSDFGVPFVAAPATNIKSVAGVSYGNISKVSKISTSSISKIIGIE
jgi:hypothetical protein